MRDLTVSLINPDQQDTRGFFRILSLALRHYGLLGAFGRWVILKDELRKFVKGIGMEGATDESFRKELLRKFNKINRHIICAHNPYEFVLLAKYILNSDLPGPIVECGCYKGGGTAKLSILAEYLGRKLYVFDSFCGLPRERVKGEMTLYGHGGTSDYRFEEGQYLGTLGEVKANVEKHGSIDVCEFVPGFFEDTLSGMQIEPSFVIMDVDLISSARTCLEHLWPRTVPGGYWFTHEARFTNYILGIFDEEWWRETFNESPPLVMGAGSGLSTIAEGFAYFRKKPQGAK